MSELLNDLVQEIVLNNNRQEKFLENSLSFLNEDEIGELNKYIQFCLDRGISIKFLANAYNLIVNDTAREQLHFRRHKKYRYSTFNEVADSVYFNNEYMEQYMYGLALSAFFWRQHKLIKDYFCQNVKSVTSGTYLEIGPGHGYFMAKSMELSGCEKYFGVDISPTSIDMTRAMLDANVWGDAKDYQLTLLDFLEWEEKAKFGTIVMGEVLEHVEQPELFLKKIHSLAHQDSFIFITTCINSPAVDHIALFRDENELYDLFSKCHFDVIDELLVPYDKLSIEESKKQELPMNVAFVLRAKEA